MLDWHLGMVETEDGRPRPLGPADALTSTRAWLVPVAADRPSPLVCAAAAATDVLDGRLARRVRDRPAPDATSRGSSTSLRRGRAPGGSATRVDRSGAVGPSSRASAPALGYALWVYFGRADAPDPAVTRAARMTTPVRVAGLVVAGTGSRRLADALIVAGRRAAWRRSALVVLAQERRTKPSFVPENSEEPGRR